MTDADNTILDGAPSGETRSSESAQPPAPDFERARETLNRLLAIAQGRRGQEDVETLHDYHSLRSVLSAAESRLSLLEAQNAELRASQRRLTTMFEEEAYHRMSAECEVARLKGGGGVTIVMHEDKEGA